MIFRSHKGGGHAESQIVIPFDWPFSRKQHLDLFSLCNVHWLLPRRRMEDVQWESQILYWWKHQDRPRQKCSSWCMVLRDSLPLLLCLFILEPLLGFFGEWLLNWHLQNNHARATCLLIRGVLYWDSLYNLWSATQIIWSQDRKWYLGIPVGSWATCDDKDDGLRFSSARNTFALFTSFYWRLNKGEATIVKYGNVMKSVTCIRIRS